MNQIYIKFKLYTCKMEEGMLIRDYINIFDRLIKLKGYRCECQ